MFGLSAVLLQLWNKETALCLSCIGLLSRTIYYLTGQGPVIFLRQEEDSLTALDRELPNHIKNKSCQIALFNCYYIKC